MSIPKREVIRRARIYLNERNLTSGEYDQIVLYCKHNVNLLDKLKRDRFIIDNALQDPSFQREFKNISRLQTASGKILNNFLALLGESRLPSLTLTNPANQISTNFSACKAH